MRSALSILAVPVLALGLTACGDDDTLASDSSKDDAKAYADTPMKQIATDVASAMKGLESVHLSGNVTDDGQTILMDLTIGAPGCEGHIEMEGVGAADLIVLDGASYFKADDAFWTSQVGDQASMITGLIGDKWVIDPSGKEGFGDLCDLDKLLSEMDLDDTDGAAEGKVVGTEKVNGIDTVKVEAPDSDGGKVGTINVAASDPHYLVRIDLPKEVSATFSDFDKPLDIEKPADSDVFDMSTFGS